MSDTSRLSRAVPFAFCQSLLLISLIELLIHFLPHTRSLLRPAAKVLALGIVHDPCRLLRTCTSTECDVGSSRWAAIKSFLVDPNRHCCQLSTAVWWRHWWTGALIRSQPRWRNKEPPHVVDMKMSATYKVTLWSCRQSRTRGSGWAQGLCLDWRRSGVRLSCFVPLVLNEHGLQSES
jgi:hypothetical protein